MSSPLTAVGDFELATPQRIVFGCGALARSLDAVRGFGKRPLLVTGSRPERALDRLPGFNAVVARVTSEPATDLIQDLASMARRESCDCVVGFGGGSAIDAAKATAAIAANGGEPLDYLEVVGRGEPLRLPSLPFLAIPTTAGSGAEATRNAVLGVRDRRVKASLRSPFLLARLAIVDPELTYDLPPALTAATGLDALTQLIEPFVSIRANAATDALCRQAIPLAARSLRAAFEGQQAARPAMAFASLMGGLALANAGLGAVHGFAAVIGGMWAAPHGAVCAALLPHVMEANLAAMPDASRYTEVARLVTGDGTARAEDGVRWVADLCRDLSIPALGTYGVSTADVGPIAGNAAKASSMKANPVVLPAEALTRILTAAI